MASGINPATSKRIRSLRIRTGRSGSGRADHGDDNIPLDLSRSPTDIVKEILQNVCSQQGVSTSRKLGHLNNFVKLLCSLPEDTVIEIPMKVIMTCLKSTLVSDVKEVRAAGARVLRYLINDDQTKQVFIDLHLDYLVTKCLDISHFNEVERIQAVRLIRKMAHMKRRRKAAANDPVIPLSLMACVVSVSLDGAEERDRVYRTCLAVLCELALLQPWLVVRCNGVLALINAILECHMYQRINECLCLSLMHIINHPSLRKWHKPLLDMSPAFAPYTELNYRLHPDVEDSKLKEELEMRFQASKMALVSLLRTWSGLLHVCNSEDMIKSFVEALLLPNDAVRRGILSVICDLFYFNELEWVDDFKVALNAAAPGHFRDSWRLAEGFVVAEAKSILPVRSVSRPDLVDCHLSIILSSFLQAGLLETLSRVAISTDACSSVSATIVLGSILHLAGRLLPSTGDSSWQWHLPHLLKNNSINTSMEESQRINLTVKRLQEVHLMHNNPPKPHSLYLSHLITDNSYHSSTKSSLPLNALMVRSRSGTGNSADASSGGSFSILKRNRSLNLIRDFSEDNSSIALKNTKVLTLKEHREWDWEALQCLFLSPPSMAFLRAVSADDALRRFYRRLTFFYQPSSKLFSALDLSKDGKCTENKKFVQTAIYMVRVLLFSDDEGQRVLKNLIVDIVESLPKVSGDAISYSKASGSLAVTCSREYFLILGALSFHPKGDQILGHCKVYHYFMGLASEDTHENLVRLLVSSLHYSEDSPAKMVLGKVLTTCNEASRLYATGFLRVLLRSNCPGFLRWGTELLTTQLFDKSNEVASEALDILHEACDDWDYLCAVVRLRPTLLHLGDRGAILVCRFMSVPHGFAYLSHNKYLNRELKRWWAEYNERYVLHVEDLLKLSLTTFERANKEDGFVRRSGNRKTRQSVHLPAHLYGELCRHEDGAAVVEDENISSRCTEALKQLISEENKKSACLKQEPSKLEKENENSKSLKMKSYLWALAHIGSTVYGLPLLKSCDALPLITRLASQSPVSSIRGTCVYCLCAIAQTIPGVEALQQLGYQCVLNVVSKTSSSKENGRMTPPQPIVTPRLIRSNLLSTSISSSSQWSTSSNTQPCKSPRGSLSNLSCSSDATVSSSVEGSKSGRSSRSRFSSRATGSESGSSFKRKHRRSEKGSCADDKSYLASPSKTALSTSNVSSRSSVFEPDTSSMASSNRLYPKTPSPSRSFDKNTLEGIAAEFGHRGTKTATLSPSRTVDRRTKTLGPNVSLNVVHSKPKFKDRLYGYFDIFSRSRRSKSISGGGSSYTLTNHQDDNSSGYVSDQLPSVEASESKHLGSPESVPVQLHTQMDVVRSSCRISSTTLASSSTNSVDTLKTGDMSGPSRRSSEVVCDANLKYPALNSSDVSDSGKDSTLKADVSLWNTNNSGQTSSMLSSTSLDRPRNQSRFESEATCTELPTSQHVIRAEYPGCKEAKRTRSLPDILDTDDDAADSPFRTLPARRLQSFRAKIHYTSKNQPDKALPSIVNPSEASKLTTSNPSVACKAAPDATPKPPTFLISTALPAISRCDNCGAGEVEPPRNDKDADSRFTDVQSRARGNTQVSQDSGVGTDSTPTMRVTSLTSRTNSPTVKDDDVACFEIVHPLGELPESANENQWRFSTPKGLAALRLIRQKQSKRSSENIDSHSDETILQSDLLTFEERDEIIKHTRYMGIAIPVVLSELFKPPSKHPLRKSSMKGCSALKQSIESDRLEASETLRERKVSTARQAPKFRGLDESTFGAAVTSEIILPKSGKMHPMVTTPFAHTPDSTLSEASDFCYIGGHLVESGSEEYVALVHEEIIQLVSNLASSVGIKAHETSLLMVKEKKPDLFDSISLYNKIMEIMSEYSFRLTTRRFVQELFQDIRFTEVYVEAMHALESVR